MNKLDCPAIASAAFTSIVIANEVVAPTESVAVMVSKYVPIASPAATVRTPELVSIVILEFVGEIENRFVPVPNVAE